MRTRRRQNPGPILGVPLFGCGVLAAYFVARRRRKTARRTRMLVSEMGVRHVWQRSLDAAPRLARARGGLVVLLAGRDTPKNREHVEKAASVLQRRGVPVMLVDPEAQGSRCVMHHRFVPEIEIQFYESSGRLQGWHCLPSPDFVDDTYMERLVEAGTDWYYGKRGL